MTALATYSKQLRNTGRRCIDMSEINYFNKKTIIESYGEMVAERMNKGFEIFIVTIQFNQINAKTYTRIDIMRKEIIHVWKVILTNTMRNYKLPIDRLPFFIAFPDLPVYKTDKTKRYSLENVTINDGMHVGGTLCIPPWTTLKNDFEKHLDEKQQHYRGSHDLIRSVSAKKVTTTPEKAVDYMFKHFKQGNFEADDIWIFPETSSEQTSSKPLARL